MIKNLVFDLGNVLISFSPETMLSYYFDDLTTIETLKQGIFYSGLWQGIDNGDLTFDQACQQAITNHPNIDPQKLRELFATWHQYKIEFQPMTDLVTQLKQRGYKLYLLSNVASKFHTYKHEYKVIQAFDGLVLSGDHHLSKPDPKLYNLLLDTYDLKAEDCLFIDDSLANIKTASSLGFFTYNYNGSLDSFKAYLMNCNLL